MSGAQNPRVTQADAPFVAVEGQSFASHQHWVLYATRRLTAHPNYNNTEHNGPAKGWRGPHFTALCFDQKGRRCRNGGDFQRAEDEGAFPVWWVWPDQIAELIMAARHREAAEAASKAREAALVEALGNLIAACDEGRTVPRGGACGMTIEAQIRASVINGVPAWPVEEARDVLDRAALTKEPDA